MTTFEAARDTTRTHTSNREIGRSPVRPDGFDKVTGKALYGADIRLPGMLFGKVLRSLHAHARILSIDTSKAEAYPGVMAVATSRDLALPQGSCGELQDSTALNMKYLRNNLLAEDKVLYRGHPVAALAATSPHISQEALRLIDVAYETLPSVTNVEDAMQPGAPILHDTLASTSPDADVRLNQR